MGTLIAPSGPSRFAAWLKRESVAAIGVSGTALTLLGELAGIVPMSPPIARVLGAWRTLVDSIWQPAFSVAGISLHPDIAAALTVAVFLVTIAIGARMAARLSGTPLPAPSLGRFLEQSNPWPSLIAFAAVGFIFLIGRSPGGVDPPVIFGSPAAGELAFPVIGAAGYLLGDFISEDAFHRRLLRAVGVVVAVLALNFLLLTFSGTAWPTHRSA